MQHFFNLFLFFTLKNVLSPNYLLCFCDRNRLGDLRFEISWQAKRAKDTIRGLLRQAAEGKTGKNREK